MIIKQAKNDIFAPNKKERKSEVRCPTHGSLLSILYGHEQHTRDLNDRPNTSLYWLDFETVLAREMLKTETQF